MTGQCDLRLLPVAVSTWVCSILTLLSGWAVGSRGALLCAALFTAAWSPPTWFRDRVLRRFRTWVLRSRRGGRPGSRERARGCRRSAGAPRQFPSEEFGQPVPGQTSSRPAGVGARRRLGSALVLPLVIVIAATAGIVTALAATAPAQEFLAAHPAGSVVRVQADVQGAPSPYTVGPAPGEQEASHGVAVDLRITVADGAPQDVAATVFATDPAWGILEAGERVEAVLRVTATAEPARLTLRGSSPPVPAHDGGEQAHGPGLRTTVRQDLARIAGKHGAVSAGLVPGMTVGDTSRLPDALAQSMKDTGLTHLTAVSGSNCALVMTLTGYAALTLGAGRRGCVLAGLAALAGFVVLVGPDPSVLRAGVMGALGGIAMLTGRPGVSLSALCAAVTGLVLVEPQLAIDYGFVLSVLATAGIVVSARPVTRLLATRLPAVLAVCVAVPLVAQLWCGPVLLLLNPTLPLYSLPANMAASPLVPVVTVAGLLAVCVLLAGHLLTPVLQLLVPAAPEPAVFTAWERTAGLPVGLASYPARLLGRIADTFARLPGAHLPWPPGPTGIALLTAATLVALAALHALDRRMRRPGPTRGTVTSAPAEPPVPDAVWRVRAREHRFRRRALAVTAALTLLALLVTAVVWWLRPAPQWESVVCDVGQGDAVLHRTGEHSAVLVDGGPDPRALQRCLHQADITHLDAVVATHDHDDHVAGLEGLTDVVDVDRIWYSTAGGALPDELAPLAEKATRPHVGDRLVAGSLTMEVLGPEPPAETAPAHGSRDTQPRGPTRATHVSSDDENNASLLLHLTLTGPHGTTTWLTGGDIEAEAYTRDTRTLPGGTAPHVDVLKVSHHGARNGGTAIIHDTHPALAVISVGKDNSYGHPHPQTVQALQEVDAAVARTDESGSLWIRKDGNRLVVSAR
ncbi:ComEC/Rec2 family competence protein [Kocuria sp. HSID17582]|nr:ComEC/Rec2 family competence protein [Kocuria sp. HSID17590]RUQ12044.1 ComEC/Rec2 family competence protein [Kocuria sp. HSID17582]